MVKPADSSAGYLKNLQFVMYTKNEIKQEKRTTCV